MLKRTIIGIILLMFSMPINNSEVSPIVEANESCFCDGHELSTREKYEELLIKYWIDTDNLLADGKISKETYEIQMEQINNALDISEIASDEEVENLYVEFLLTNLDWLENDLEAGEEVDMDFYNYLVEELEKTKKDGWY